MADRFPARTTVVSVFITAAAAMLPAEAQEACLISPQAPAFGEANGEDLLHPRPQDVAAAHSGTHGQLIIGEQTFYWSHLPVFMGNPGAHPHNFQVILEVAFGSADDEVAYRQDRRANPDVFYTVVPPVFEQTALIENHSDGVPIDGLPDTAVVRGHFERDGQTILATDFGVERVVYYREFPIDGDRLERQSYLLFGKGEDVFLAHLLSAPPDFDQILTVAVEAPEVPTETIRGLVTDLIAGGIFLQLPDRENQEATRLGDGDTITCSLETGTRALPVRIELSVGKEIYCESGEFDALVLDSFNTPRPCRE